MKKALITSLAALACASADAASITALGFLPGRSASSRAAAISGDGKVVVGYCEAAPNSTGQRHAFRWSVQTGMQDIHQFLGDPSVDFSEADAVSADGSVIVGQLDYMAFRWRRTDGMVPFNNLPGTSSVSFASAVSSDGSIIFGNANDGSGFRAVKWTAPDVIIPIPNLEMIYGCSGDGAIAIGYGPAGYRGTAMRWEDGVGSLALGDFSQCTNDCYGSSGLAVSRDGKVLVGNAYPKNGSCVLFDEAFDGFR